MVEQTSTMNLPVSQALRGQMCRSQCHISRLTTLYSTAMQNWQRLFVNGCESTRPNLYDVISFRAVSRLEKINQCAQGSGVLREGGQPPTPRKSEVLTKPRPIPCSVENTSVTT
jgi:hypothetical protein